MLESLERVIIFPSGSNRGSSRLVKCMGPAEQSTWLPRGEERQQQAGQVHGPAEQSTWVPRGGGGSSRLVRCMGPAEQSTWVPRGGGGSSRLDSGQVHGTCRTEHVVTQG